METTEYLANGSNPKQLFKQVAEFDVESVLLVGHEPFLSETISLLISGNTNIDIEMNKCSIAFVEILGPIRPGSGILKELINIQTISQYSIL
jgi:phosphohistidine phosphatase SixA